MVFNKYDKKLIIIKKNFFRSAAKAEQDRVRSQKTNRMLISMVVVFGIGWLPLNTINLLADMNFKIYCWKYHHFMFFISHVMAMSSTCYNPFLYGKLLTVTHRAH